MAINPDSMVASRVAATTPEMVRVSGEQASARFSQLANTHSITVLIPARNEERTVGEVVSKLMDRYNPHSGPQVQIVVIDDHSTDNTSAAAAKSGAQVLTRNGPGDATGKAETITEGIRRFPSDIYVLFDADISNFSPDWVELLCSPIDRDNAMLAKGTYHRPVQAGFGSHERFLEGGRVTELVARPLLSLCFPDLAKFGQPLSGEVAFKAELANSGPFFAGYGFDVGLLIDSYQRFGLESIVEVDLGERTHNHQELRALSYQASQVASTILIKAGIDVAALPGAGRLIRPSMPDKTVPFGALGIPKST